MLECLVSYLAIRLGATQHFFRTSKSRIKREYTPCQNIFPAPPFIADLGQNRFNHPKAF